jgi:uncharacterized protein (TIGR02611 family)
MNWLVAAILAALLCLAVGMVLLARASILPGSMASGAERLARLTLKQAKRVVILVLGTTILIVGIIMIVAPGPAILVIPLGLAVLATEFVWARRLLIRYKGYADQLVKRVGHKSPWVPRPWMVGVVMALTIAVAIVVIIITDWPHAWIASVTSSVLLMEGVTMYLAVTARTWLAAKNPPPATTEDRPHP